MEYFRIQMDSPFIDHPGYNYENVVNSLSFDNSQENMVGVSNWVCTQSVWWGSGNSSSS